MAAENGLRDSQLDPDPVLQTLDAEPWIFSFFQAVRLLEFHDRGREPVGRFAPPQSELVRFSSCQTLIFPASEIQSLIRRGDGPSLMSVNFMGLTGPMGVLPLAYSSLVSARLREKDATLRDFFDLFNHRFVSLFYRAWTKYRFPVTYERDGRGALTGSLLDMVGLGIAPLQNRQAVADDTFIFYSGLVAQRPRSAESLRQVLTDYFDVPVSIRQFAGAWNPLHAKDQCLVGEPRGITTQLGVGSVIGDEVWYMQSRVRIVLGPLSLEQYQDFLPGGSAHEPLKAITRFFAEQELDFEAQLILKREEAPPCSLGEGQAGAALLGWVSWMKSKPLDRDPADTILRL